MSDNWKLFNDSPLNQWLKDHLQSVNIERPSPIQMQLIKAIMSHDGKRIKRNVFGCSPTGTGKTLAYVLPLLHFLTQDLRPYFALILAPTRELAFQIYEIIKVLTGSSSKDNSSTMIKTLLLIGGGKTNIKTGETGMQGFWAGKPNIIVATPGRMVEELTNRNFQEHTGHRSALRFDFLVLDEADLLIGPTFASQLKEVLDAIDTYGCGNSRQTLVLSATLTSALEQLQKLFSNTDDESLKPVTINLLPTLDEMKLEISTNPNLDQRYIICPEAMKPAYLIQALSDISFKQAIVFCSSTRQAMILHKLMINLGFDEPEVKCHPVLLVGSKDQKERLRALEKFKSLKSRIMIATGGLAGRGLDLPQVDLVIQYNCPTNPVDYIHRVGRTCRKIDFAKIDEVERIRANLKNLRALANTTKQPVDVGEKDVNDSSSTEVEEEDDITCDNDDSKKVDSDLDAVCQEESKAKKAENEMKHKNKKLRLSKAVTKYYGKAILFVTQYDVELMKNIEEFVNVKLVEEDDLDANNVTNILKPVAIALKDAELSVIEEQVAARDKLKR